MAVGTGRWYSNGRKAFNAGDVDWDADTIKTAVLASTYTPSQAHDFFNDVSAHEVTGTGYTAGGVTLTTKTNAQILDTAVTAWASATAYSVGDIRRPSSANGRIYACAVAGISGGSEPTWPTTSRLTVVDNTITWAEAGIAVVALGADNVTWDPSSIIGRYAVTYMSTGTASTSPLLGYLDFGEDQESDGADFNINWDNGHVLRDLIRS